MRSDHDTPARKLHRARRLGWRLVWFRLAAFLAVMGPGFITANVDNDPGGIFVYSQAGAKFGYSLLWTLIPTTVALIVVQEMAARMGAVTGKGLSDLIREEFGLRITVFTMVVLGLADLGNIAAEFAGIASGMGIFGISKYLTVPAGAAVVWFVIVRGSYKPVLVPSLFPGPSGAPLVPCVGGKWRDDCRRADEDWSSNIRGRYLYGPTVHRSKIQTLHLIHE